MLLDLRPLPSIQQDIDRLLGSLGLDFVAVHIRRTDHEIFFASCEARAHLNHLVSRGDLVRDMQDGVAVFSSA